MRGRLSAGRSVADAARADSVRRHAPQANGHLRAVGVPARPRHDDLGPRHRHETASDQLRTFLDAGGTLVDTAHGYGDGPPRRSSARCSTRTLAATTSSSAPRPASPGARASASSTPRGQPAQPARHVAAAARHRPRRPLAGAHVERRGAAEETLSALEWAVDVGPGPLRRGLELLRLAERARACRCSSRRASRWWPTRSSTPC